MNTTTMGISYTWSEDVLFLRQNSSIISSGEQRLSEYGKTFGALSNNPGLLREFISYNGTTVLSAIVVLSFLWQYVSLDHNPKEPQLIKHRIPFVGHLIVCISME